MLKELGEGKEKAGLAGGFLMGLLGFKPEGSMIYTIIVAVIGAIVVTWIYRKLVAKPA